MSAFTDQLKTDADNTFLADFGESIVYTPQGGSPITINAIVTLNPLQKDGATPRQLSKEYHVQVSRTDVPDRPVLSGAKVTITGQPAMYVVGVLNESDPGMWHLLVR